MNPRRAELMSDGIDNDCDDLTDQIRRPCFVGFWGGAHVEWAYSGGTVGTSDSVHIPSGGAARLVGAFPWKRGEPNVGLMVYRTPGTSCTLMASGALGTSRAISSAVSSWDWVNIPVDLGTPPYDIVDLDITCSGGAGMTVDWLRGSGGATPRARGAGRGRPTTVCSRRGRPI